MRVLIISMLFFIVQCKALDSTIIYGTLNFENKQAIIGANVIVPGTKLGVTTDIDGKFKIKVPSQYTELEFSYIGYKTKSVKINHQKDQYRE